MAWTKKAASPDYLRIEQAIVTAITGTPDAWILPWMNLATVGGVIEVERLCQAGPPEPVEFGPLDFVGFIPGVSNLIGHDNVALGEKISRWVMSRLFASNCEQIVAAGWVQFYHNVVHVTADWWYDPWPPAMIPVGATKVRVKYEAGGFMAGDVLFNSYKPGQFSVTYRNSNEWQEVIIAAGIEDVRVGGKYNIPGSSIQGPYDSDITFQAFVGGGAAEFEQPAIEQPASAIPPTPGVYNTIADLGAELDELEKKLHWVLDYTSGEILTEKALLAADEIMEVTDAAEDIPLDDEVEAFIVTCSGIPASVDVGFGSPPELWGMGRVVLGNGTAWNPPVHITVSPMLLFKTSRFQTVCRVDVVPGATATVTTLKKVKIGSAGPPIVE